MAVAAESYSNIPICLVLDNHSLIDGIKDVVEVGRLLRPVMHPDSRVILTTRCVDPTILGLLEDAFLMPMEALRFSVVETQQLLAMSGAADTTHETSTEIRTITCGHAALTTLLVRQMVVGCFEVGTSQAPSLDVTVYLLQILDQLGEQDRRLMYACALLGSGSGRELARLFGKPCADGLRRLSAAVPLVRMDCRGDAATFAVHGLAREVYMDLDYRERRIPGWTDIRKGALLALDDRGDYAQLFSELLQESSALEMSEWLERRGRHLMQMGNHGLIHDALEACGTGMMLARPHLLLLSAELLRDRGAYGDALHKARVAKDLAGYSGDDELRYFSCLLVARLQIDMGLVADAVESLGEAITLGE
ncbi:MAG: hypothetical protein Q8M66_01655, partial [Actinomycetota bacterium]|nr:hypothetical protein [Actinomycetota bacterium]